MDMNGQNTDQPGPGHNRGLDHPDNSITGMNKQWSLTIGQLGPRHSTAGLWYQVNGSHIIPSICNHTSVPTMRVHVVVSVYVSKTRLSL